MLEAQRLRLQQELAETLEESLALRQLARAARAHVAEVRAELQAVRVAVTRSRESSMRIRERALHKVPPVAR